MTVKPFGVIEGFYGDPWTTNERLACIDFLSANGANTYVWAPKSEPRHRDRWAEPFSEVELEDLSTLIGRSDKVIVSVALTPGAEATPAEVIGKLAPVVERGCRSVTLCFDDLPVLHAGTRHRELANAARDGLGCGVWLVPTHYAGTTGSPYLTELVTGLDDEILVMWTGRAVVTDNITESDAMARTVAMAGRAPLLWDNTPVNDAMMSTHLHLGPYTGRPRSLAGLCAGVLLNPMVSMRASLPTIESACAWWRGEDPIAAWEQVVDRDGWRRLAEATAYPGDAHWPGLRPSRAWLTEVAALESTGDPDVDPWIESAREGARLCLAALDVTEAMADGARASEVVRGVIALAGVSAWMQRPVRTLGAGPRMRPVFTQDDRGRFEPTGDTIVRTLSIVEAMVDEAMTVIGRT